MQFPYSFNESQFNRLFPFFLRINRELEITAMGTSVASLYELRKNAPLNIYFSVPRPYTPLDAAENLVELNNQLVILESTIPGKPRLRGQLEVLEESGELLFVGSPWFDSMEQVLENNLVIDDFARHDPMIDLLHVLKTQEITNDDLRQLLKTVKSQKEKLQLANREISEIALFPTQNPDPLIRVNMKGELLRMNPAAESISSYVYNDREYSPDAFWKMICAGFNHGENRFIVEAVSDNKVFSYLVVPIPDSGYCNIYGRDVTEQKRIQQELEIQSTVASANENAVLFTSTAGNITWANDAFCKLTGYAMDEVIGKSPVELCSGPMTNQGTLNEMKESVKEGQGATNDLLLYRKDKALFWGHLENQPIRNEQGEITAYFEIITDITEKKKQEEQLRILSSIAAENTHGVVIADANGKIEWVNKSFERISGYTLAEMIGKKPGHILQGPDTDTKAIAYLKEKIAKGEPFVTEILNYSKSKKPYWLRIQGQALRDKNGKIIKYFAIEEDVTREKESEQRFKQALQSVGDNIWEHDFRKNNTYFSKSNNTLLGYDSDELTNNQQLWWNCVHKADLHLLEETDRKYRSGAADAHRLEYRMIHKDGSIRWVLDRGVVIERDNAGLPLKITGTHTDITNNKQTEVELANRVKQFQTLSENIPGVIYEFEFKRDGTEGIRYISPAIEKIFGIRQQDFINYLQYIHPDDRDIVIAKNNQSREHRTPFYLEARLLIPGQPMRWHSVHSAFSYQTDQGDDVFTGFMLDITERKNIEHELEVQRKFYESILNNMPADIAVFSPAHEYLFLNPRAISDETFRKWMIGKRDEDFCAYRGLHVSLAEKRRAVFNAVISDKSSSEWIEEIHGKDGNKVAILRRLFPVVDKNNEVQLVIGYGIDITQRLNAEKALKANEEKYRGIIENMNLGLMEMSKEGKIEFANHTVLEMTGITEEEILGYDGMQFISEDSIDEVKYRMKKRVEGISEAYEVQTRIGGKKGWWFVSTAPRYTTKGEHNGSIVICLDITKQKNLEQELIKSREQAEKLARTKENFLANMSHEIRTPMNAIIGMGNQLAKTKLNGQQGFYLQTIKTAAENLLVIIDDILDLSKIEAGKLTVEKIGFEPRKVVANAMQVLLHKAEEKGLKLTNFFFDPEIAPILIGDPYRINQVLLNLISNAIKFTEKGSVDVACEVLADSSITQQIRVSVSDTGIGMDKDFVNRLFDKFSQEYESVTRKYGGTGLGMSICKELVELMGGTLVVQSEKGRGTTVQFVLECQKGTGTDMPKNLATEFTGDFLQGRKILITDDNDMNRLVASTILNHYGVHTIEAVNGEQAVLMIRENNPDLVLMDIQMPVMNGYEATMQVRKTGNQVPIIALTANAIKGENEKCIAAGMNDYIAKPFQEEDLLKIIAHWLQSAPAKAEPVLGQVKGVTSGVDIKYDLSALDNISRGNQEFINKMIQLFIELAPTSVLEIKEAYRQNDLEKVKKTAHRLKPSIDNISLQPLKKTIREIENCTVENAEPGKLFLLIDTLDNEIGVLVSQLRAYLHRAK